MFSHESSSPVPARSTAASADASALGRLLTARLPQLVRWAHNRLPRWARTGVDTADLVQDALVRTLPRARELARQGEEALAAYLRRTVANRVNDEHRRVARSGRPRPLPEGLADGRPSACDEVERADILACYGAALEELGADDRALIAGRFELEYSYEQLGCMTGRSAHAARMALRRALGRLLERMSHG